MRYTWVFFLLLVPSSLLSGTWYVRTDGGTAAQCTGTTDAPYPGSGSGQDCAFINPFYLWTNDPPANKSYEIPAWKIAGGDTVVIKNGEFRMGFKVPGAVATGWWNYLGCRGNPWSCYNPPIPPGTPDNPTRIVGEGWQTGCLSKPILRGAGSTQAVLNLYNTHDVSVECLEFTDAAQCRVPTFPQKEPYACVSGQSDHAYWALQTNLNTFNLTLRNLFIHGMGAAGIYGAIGGNVVAENIHMRANGNLGWVFDPGAGQISVGPLTIRKAIIEWSACVERWPMADPLILACYDQAGANANGDGLGFVDLDGDIFIDQSIIRYNQQDGLDALYVKSGKTLSVTNSQFYGNSGQQIKTGGAANVIIRNNLVVGNCSRQREGVTGVTEASYNELEKGFCRASDMVALIFKNDSSIAFENNTLVTTHPTAFNVQCTTITDIFNGSGRRSTDTSVDSTLTPDGVRREFPTAYPIVSMFMNGTVYLHPKVGSRLNKRVGQRGVDTLCGALPCQFWYTAGSAVLTQDPSEPVLGPTDELRVNYYNPTLCSNSTMSFSNNIVRGYHPLWSTEDAGSFWFYNLPAGSPIQDSSKRFNNSYCGVKAFSRGPTETYSPTCPGSFFAGEPPAFTAESQLDALNLYPGPGSPAVDAAMSIGDLVTDFDGTPRPYGAAPDLGALELAPVSPVPTGSLRVRAASGGNNILTWSHVPGAAYYDVQRRIGDQGYSGLDTISSTLINMSGVTYNDPPPGPGACYRIRAGNALGAADWSEESCVAAVQADASNP